MSIAGAAPFSLQSPETIAKQYEGNKQKIAQAVQMGLVDPTAGTLAGMFIDRMRAGAMQEHGTPPTVAQQVLGAHPPAPPAPPPGGPPAPQMGMGAPHPMMPAAAPPAPQQGMPAPMGGPPVRAADGGLMSIPIPDQMFDEPSGMSMARGGLVAFARGGDTDGGYDDGTVDFAPQGDGDGDGGGGDTSQDHAQYMAVQRARAVREAQQHAYNMAHNGIAPPQAPPQAPSQAPPAMPLANPASHQSGPQGGRPAWAGQASPYLTGFPTQGDTSEGGILHQAPTVDPMAHTTPQWLQNNRAGRAAIQSPLAGFLAGREAQDDAAKPAWLRGVQATDGTKATADVDLMAGLQGALARPLPGQPGANPAQARGGPGGGGGGGGGNGIGNLAASASFRTRGGGLNIPAAPMGVHPTPTAAPPIPSLDKSVGDMQQLLMDPQTKAYYDGQTDRLDKQKKEDLWTSLAQIGFGMAASKNPYFLGAVGEAGTAALPGMQKALSDRRAEENDFAKQQMQLHQTGVQLGVQQHQNDQQNATQNKQLDQQLAIANAQIDAAWKAAMLQANTTIGAARISASKANETDFKFSVEAKRQELIKGGMTPVQATSQAIDKVYESMGLKNPQKGTPQLVGFGGSNAIDAHSLPQ